MDAVLLETAQYPFSKHIFGHLKRYACSIAIMRQDDHEAPGVIRAMPAGRLIRPHQHGFYVSGFEEIHVETAGPVVRAGDLLADHQLVADLAPIDQLQCHLLPYPDLDPFW